SAEFGECHSDILLSQSEGRIELQRLVEGAEGNIWATQLQVNPAERVPVDRNGIVECDGLLDGRERRTGFLVFDVLESAVIGSTGLQALDFGRLIRRRAARDQRRE